MKSNQKVLIIGGGLAGIETALQLARPGFEVTVAEKERQLGGRFRHINTVAGMETSPRDYIAEKINHLASNPSVNIMVNTVPVEVRGLIGRFEVALKQDGKEFCQKYGAIVLATGFSNNIVNFPQEGILSLVQMEEMLGKGYDFSGKSISIVLDSETGNSDLLSKLAIKNALLLKKKYRGEVNVFYKNIKVSGDNWEKLYVDTREAGVRFFRIVDQLEVEECNGKMRISFRDSFISGMYLVESDFVVLPDEIESTVFNNALGSLLQLNLKYDLFSGKDTPYLDSGITSRNGIFMVGSCRWPCLTNEIICSAGAAAHEIARQLGDETLLDVSDQPQVDPLKCTVCLTCYRCCPHKAITIEHDDIIDNIYHSAARMDPLACRRCGLCVAECPAKAINMPGNKDEQILARLDALEV